MQEYSVHFDGGYQAYVDHKEVDAVPYPLGSSRRLQWLIGWVTARNDKALRSVE